MEPIEKWRQKIDELDAQLVKLLNDRAKYAEEIGKLKSQLGFGAYSPEREEEIMRHVTETNQGPLPLQAIRRLFERILDESRSVERAAMETDSKSPSSKPYQRYPSLIIRLLKENMRLWLPPAAIFFVVLLFIYSVFWFPNSFDDPSGRVVTVPRGSSFKAVMDSLNSAGVIRSRFTLKVAGRLLGYTKSIKVGKYLFHSGMSNTNILQDLQEGKSRMILPVSIPEGRRIVGIARRFSADLGIDSAKFVSICRDSEYVRHRGFKGGSLEGYLMPETYNFYWQTDETEIVNQLVDGFKQFYVDSLRKRQEELKMTMHEVLTLASIVEGESGIDEERPMIAGVYWNRLKKRMKLEADPTIQYVLPDGPRRLLNRDLKFKSPYNTYLNYGLPPGPINNPGKKAILATLYPEKHQYLFFVATGVGGHRFSKTFTEHQKAAKAYRRARREVEKQMKLSNGLTNKG